MRRLLGTALLGLSAGLAGYLSGWPLWGVAAVALSLSTGVRMLSDGSEATKTGNSGMNP